MKSLVITALLLLFASTYQAQQCCAATKCNSNVTYNQYTDQVFYDGVEVYEQVDELLIVHMPVDYHLMVFDIQGHKMIDQHVSGSDIPRIINMQEFCGPITVYVGCWTLICARQFYH